MTTDIRPRFRYVGVTDECVECQRCGKADLKRTVVLAILDADGNAEDVTYYGSNCAARALAELDGRRTTGRSVLALAEMAARKLKRDAEAARAQLAFYGVDGQQPFDRITLAEAANRFAHQHRFATWAREKSGKDWEGMVYDMVTRRTATIHEAEQFGL